MNLLSELYEFLYSMISRQVLPGTAWGAGAFQPREEEMPVTLAMALLGAGGIALYIRFFVALSRERKTP